MSTSNSFAGFSGFGRITSFLATCLAGSRCSILWIKQFILSAGSANLQRQETISSESRLGVFDNRRSPAEESCHPLNDSFLARRTMMREKQLTKSAMKILKHELFRWVCERHATNSVLDKRLLCEKALELTKTFELTGFKCSSQWISNFLKEHYIVTEPANQLRLNPVFSNYRDWIDMMRSTITRYKYRDLFHVDELSMYSDVLPWRISSSSKIVGDPDGRTTSRNRITVLLGCNSSGSTKLPLVVCGPYTSRTTTKDHVYCHSEGSSISDDLFRDWLTDLNDRMSRANRKILLFLRHSRGRALRDFPLSNVSLVYLPKDFPPLLRPLRKDVFHYVKMIFRRRYAERLKRHTSEWNLRDILESLIEAWETLPQEIVVYSFQRTHFRTDDNFLHIDCDCWNSLHTGISFKRFVMFDDNLSDEPPSASDSGRYHGYNLRRSSREVVQVNEDSVDSIPDEIEGTTMNESARDHPVESTESRTSAPKESERVAATSRDKCHSGRRGRSSENLEQKGPTVSEEHGESLNRTFGETSPEFPAGMEGGEQHGASRDTPGSIMNTFAARDCNVGLAGSIASEVFKRDSHPVHRHQAVSNNVTGSVQAIIDKALTRTTTAKADYARKLIADIYALNREPGSSTTNDPETREDTVNEGASMSSNAPAESYESSKGTAEETCSLEGAAPCQTMKTETAKKRRMSSGTNVSEGDSDSSMSAKKKLKTDREWFKEFETTFVFGSQNSASCSSSQERNDNMAVSCTVNVTPSASPRK
ncbi:uncharacterized protein LOC143359480 [Halictus rubicundus]|uniref:uncharacterized protein LOC143359480 n=1 Tax=Halictus rubicundus TaxID=77578 RepID=UPI0040367BB0